MLAPNKDESVRLFTYAFNSLGEPQGSVILTPSSQGVPKLFNALPTVVKAKMEASTYADPVTFPPTAKLSAEQTNVAGVYNTDLAMLEGAAAPAQPTQGATTTPQQAAPVIISPPTAPTIHPAAGQQQGIYQQVAPIYPAPQLPQQPQLTTPLAQAVQPTIPRGYISPATQPTGVQAGSVSSPVAQPVQPVIPQPTITPAVPPIGQAQPSVSSPVAQPVQPVTPQPTITPAVPPTSTAPATPRKSGLTEPDFMDYTQQQLTKQTKVTGWE
jgi:hypothetical protein